MSFLSNPNQDLEDLQRILCDFMERIIGSKDIEYWLICSKSHKVMCIINDNGFAIGKSDTVKTPRNVVFVPLSPTHLMMISSKRDSQRITKLTDKEVFAIANHLTQETAKRYVIYP